MILSCYACGSPNEILGSIGRRDTCQNCNTDLRCCLQCRFFDEGAPSQCREPHAETQKNKNQANFCELFAPQENPGTTRKEQTVNAKETFEALFKK